MPEINDYKISRRTALKNAALLGGVDTLSTAAGAESSVTSDLIEIGYKHTIETSADEPLSMLNICDPDKYRMENNSVIVDTDVADQTEIEVIKSNNIVVYGGDFEPVNTKVEYNRPKYLNANLSPKLQPNEAFELADPYEEPSVSIKEATNGSVVIETRDRAEKIEQGEDVVQQFAKKPMTVVTHEATGELVDTNLEVPDQKLARKIRVGTEEVNVRQVVHARRYRDIIFKFN